MRLVVNFFLLFWCTVFFVYSAGAGSSVCGSAFEQAAVDIAKKQNLEEFLKGLGEAVKNEQATIEEAKRNRRIAKARRMISDSLDSMTPKQKTHLDVVKEYIKQLVSWGFSKEEAFEIAVKNEPFRSLNDRKFEEIKGNIERLVDLGLSGKEAFKTFMLIDSKHLRRVAGNEKLTPKERQQKILAITQYIEWLVGLGVSGKEAVKMLESKYNYLFKFLRNEEKLTPQQQHQLEAVKQHVEWLMSLGFSVKEALAKSEHSKFGFRRGITPERRQEIKEEMDQLAERFGISDKTVRSLRSKVSFKEIVEVLDRLSNSGFGDLTIGKIAEADIFAVNNNLFFVSRSVLEKKKDKLRRAGLTEEEISRVPIRGVMKPTYSDQTGPAFVVTAVVLFYVGLGYGVYSLF